MTDFENPAHEIAGPSDISSPEQTLGSIGLSEMTDLDVNTNDGVSVRDMLLQSRPPVYRVNFFEQTDSDFKHWPC